MSKTSIVKSSLVGIDKSIHVSIDLKPKIREPMIALLNTRLADCLDLHSQFKQAHWNVKGMQFIALHELFDRLAAEFLAFTDLLAERIAALGGYACGTARMVADASSLPEYPSAALSGVEHLNALVERIALFGKLVRAGIESSQDDAVTADLLTEIARATDQNLWFLEAHLQ